mmetsp:Transcript_108562/g.338428  ORF Transcript_108562/g.338428 Transcript_108562/m.338428 type:complete len:415 (-) Transcript_108562:192-1436(-)
MHALHDDVRHLVVRLVPAGVLEERQGHPGQKDVVLELAGRHDLPHEDPRLPVGADDLAEGGRLVLQLGAQEVGAVKVVLDLLPYSRQGKLEDARWLPKSSRTLDATRLHVRHPDGAGALVNAPLAGLHDDAGLGEVDEFPVAARVVPGVALVVAGPGDPVRELVGVLLLPRHDGPAVRVAEESKEVGAEGERVRQLVDRGGDLRVDVLLLVRDHARAEVDPSENGPVALVPHAAGAMRLRPALAELALPDGDKGHEVDARSSGAVGELRAVVARRPPRPGHEVLHGLEHLWALGPADLHVPQVLLRDVDPCATCRCLCRGATWWRLGEDVVSEPQTILVAVDASSIDTQRRSCAVHPQGARPVVDRSPQDHMLDVVPRLLAHCSVHTDYVVAYTNRLHGLRVHNLARLGLRILG